jgi:CheY-like chemotaxis protein
MPLINGNEAVKIIKNNPSTKKIPVFAITASINPFSDIEELKTNFEQTILKPIDLENFIDYLKPYLKYEDLEDNKVLEINELNDEELDENQISLLPGLIATLEDKFFKQYTEVIEDKKMNKIKKFGENLAVLGKNGPFPDLTNYGNDLCILSDNFEIDKLINLLNSFPNLIRKFKKLTSK